MRRMPSLAILTLACLTWPAPARADLPMLVDPVAKGRHWVGISLGAQSQHLENTSLPLQQVVEGDESSWRMDVSYGKFVREGTSLGAAFHYGHDETDFTTDESIGPDKRLEERTSTAGLAVQSRSYLPLGNPHFHLYNQTALSAALTWGSVKTTTGSTVEGDVSGQRYALDLQPGIAVLIVRGFAVEASVNVLGISYETERTEIPGQPDAVKTGTKLDFQLDLLKLGIGLTLYF